MRTDELNKIRQEIANEIKLRRNELGISQLSLAERTGVGIATIKRFESGNYWISMKPYILIRDALQLSNKF